MGISEKKNQKRNGRQEKYENNIMYATCDCLPNVHNHIIHV